MIKKTPAQLIATTPRNLDELFRRYQLTPEAQSSAPNTKVLRARAFDAAIRRFHGTLSIADIEDRGFRTRLYDWRDANAHRPHAIRDAIKMISTVFNWAVDRNIMRDNPAAGFKHFKSGSRADIIWTPDTIGAFREAASPALRDAFDVGLWTALRTTDVCNLRGYNFEDGWLTVTPKKTRKHGITLYLPYHLLYPLASVIFNNTSNQRKVERHFLVNDVGEPWTESWLRRCFATTIEKAGIDPVLQFRDLRGTCITRLLEAGCTPAEVGAISGHGIAAGNMRSYAARTRPLAENAYKKLSALGL